MTAPKVLFIDSVHPVLNSRLTEMGYEWHQPERLSRAEIVAQIGAYTGIVIRSKVIIDREILDAATNLKWIARSGSGLENIDTAYAASKGIACLNSPEGNRDAVGEQTVGMLLSLFNHLNRADREVRAGLWRREENRGIELNTRTVGIIGYGNMGSAFAQRLQGFGCRVLAYDKYKTGFGSNYVQEVDETTLMAEADIVSLHVPLTDETHQMVNAAWLNRFSKPIYVLNLARGKVLCTADLVAALKSGKVPGAALDVLEYESHSFETLNKAELPEPFQYLVQADNVLLSPHIGGWTAESYVKLSESLARKIAELGKGS